MKNSKFLYNAALAFGLLAAGTALADPAVTADPASMTQEEREAYRAQRQAEMGGTASGQRGGMQSHGQGGQGQGTMARDGSGSGGQYGRGGMGGRQGGGMGGGRGRGR